MTRSCLILCIVLVTSAFPVHAAVDAPVLLHNEGDPTFTMGDDHVWAFFPNPVATPAQEGNLARLVVISPEGYVLEARYSPLTAILQEAGKGVVARIGFDLSVDARYSEEPDRNVSPDWFELRTYHPSSPTVRVDNLVGVRSDGTWTILNPVLPRVGLATESDLPLSVGGARLSIGGRIFDDVGDRGGLDSEPIEDGGTGAWAGEFSAFKMWNLHAQTVTRYDTSPDSLSNALNPEQSPHKRRFFSEAAGIALTSFFTAPEDHFQAHLVPGSSAGVVAPDGRGLTVEHKLDAPCLWEKSLQVCTIPAIIRMGFDGSFSAFRVSDQETLGADKFEITVNDDLLGAPRDGTWRVTAGANVLGLPAGIRVEIGGKVFNHVSPEAGTMETYPYANDAGDHTFQKLWNWHNQAPSTVYQTGESLMTRKEECPLQSRTYVELSVDCGPRQDVPAGDQIPPTPKGPVGTGVYDGELIVYVDEDNDGRYDPGEPRVAAVSDARHPMPPTLTAGRVSQTSGTTQTDFTFSVDYTGLPPQAVYLVVTDGYANVVDILHHPFQDDPRIHAMGAATANTVQGATYTYTTRLKPGDHRYHFETVDALFGTARLPAEGDLAGPWVE